MLELAKGETVTGCPLCGISVAAPDVTADDQGDQQ